MAILHLDEEQVRTWTREQKDRWWLENVYRGDMAQLTLRSGLTGFLLGGMLAATAMYIGAKTGIAIGVNLTSVILAFACFRLLASAGLARDLTILENNCAQSIATAAGYMITPFIASLPAYMLVTGHIPPWWQLVAFSVVVASIGVLVAFPMKRRFINDEQMPFPEGRAAGVVLDSLYSGHADTGMFKARLLAVTAGFTGLYQFVSSDGWMRLLQFRLLGMDRWLSLKEPWQFMERVDTYYYALAARYTWAVPSILGTDFRTLGLRFTLDAAMLGVGGLMGIRVATSCLIGALLNFAVLAPIMIQRGEIREYSNAAGVLVPISRGEIVNQWSLWWAVTMMVVGSLAGLLSRPEVFTGLFSRRSQVRTAPAGSDVLRHIELPLWLSWFGVPPMCLLGAALSHYFFGVPWLLALVSFPLIFVLSVICTNAMALTSWTPTGSLAKITQFTMGAIDRSNPASNLIPAGMTAEIASNAANLLSDIKPGYMLGAKPRQQAMGHVIGIIAGSIAVAPLFFLLLLPPDAAGNRSTATLVTDQFAMPAAMQWKGVADLIARGVSSLPDSAVISMVVAALAALLFEALRITTGGRFPLSAVAIGLGVVLPPESCLAMWLGAMFFWFMGRGAPAPGTPRHNLWVDGLEPVCAGLISGAALVGIGNAIVNVLM